MKKKIDVSINGEVKSLEIESGEMLLDVLRREGYRGAKVGCREGFCGACTVLLDGRPVNSCMVFAARAAGKSITTIEGLGEPGRLHPIQEAFLEAGAVQCGYCVPGAVLSAKALLDRDPRPADADIRSALDGNLCRCTGYKKQIEAVRLAAVKLKGRKR